MKMNPIKVIFKSFELKKYLLPYYLYEGWA